jgi:hypothetical protein
MRWRVGGTWVLMIGVALSAASMLSCSGPAGESITGPSVVTAAPADVPGSVTEASAANVVVCHKGKDLSVAGPAVAAHLGHGDQLGSCTASCPCFSREGIEQLAATCSVGLGAQCDVQYSLQLYCSPGPFSSNLGYFEAQVGQDSCVSITQDDVTGDLVRTERAVNNAQYLACVDAIVLSSPYQLTDPTSCPR